MASLDKGIKSNKGKKQLHLGTYLTTRRSSPLSRLPIVGAADGAADLQLLVSSSFATAPPEAWRSLSPTFSNVGLGADSLRWVSGVVSNRLLRRNPITPSRSNICVIISSIPIRKNRSKLKIRKVRLKKRCCSLVGRSLRGLVQIWDSSNSTNHLAFTQLFNEQVSVSALKRIAPLTWNPGACSNIGMVAYSNLCLINDP